MAPNKLTMKLSKHLCLECSTCAMFLSSSFTVSIMALSYEPWKGIITSITSVFDIIESRRCFRFPVGFSVYFAVITSKKLAGIDYHTKYFRNSSIGDYYGFFIYNCLYISSLMLQRFSLITKSIDTYNSSRSR